MRFPNSDLRWLFNLNWSHIGEVNTGSDLDPGESAGAFNLFNRALGLKTTDDRYEAILWGRNLGTSG